MVVLWGDPSLVVQTASGPSASDDLAPAEGEPTNGARPSPLVSVLMPVHDPDPEHLQEAIESVRAQTHSRWELCLADDGSRDPRAIRRRLLEDAAQKDERIRLRRVEHCAGIAAATNDALALAHGELVALVDHDDVLHPEALETVVEHLDRHPETGVVFTDEDRLLHDGTFAVPILKPGFSPEFLRAGMYMNHLTVYRRSLVEELGGARTEFDGSQDYDLMLRALEAGARIEHLPRVLYHWRAHHEALRPRESGPASMRATKRPTRALDAHYARTGVPARAEMCGLRPSRVIHDVASDTSTSILLARRRTHASSRTHAA